MYPPKTVGILELLMNALPFPRARRSAGTHRPRALPNRRETAVRRSISDGVATKEMYFETARLTRWTR
jgi:hypothetical protein